MDRSGWRLFPRAVPVRRVVSALGQRSVLLSGGAGMGKTHLLAQVAVDCEKRGWAVDRVAGTDLLVTVRHGWRQLSGGHRLLLAVDDLHLLGDGSLAALSEVLGGGEASVLATADPAADWSPALSALARGDAFEPVAVEPLGRREVGAWAAGVLGGPASDRFLDELWETSVGEPGALRALLTGAADACDLHLEHGGWAGSTPLAVTGPMVHAIGQRLAGFDPPRRAAVELVALAGTLPLTFARRLLAADVLASVDRCPALTTADRDGMLVIRSRAPFCAETVIAGLSPARRRLRLEQLVEAFTPGPLTDPRDIVQLTSWYLELDLDLAERYPGPSGPGAPGWGETERAAPIRHAVCPGGGGTAMLLAEALTLMMSRQDEAARRVFDRARRSAEAADEEARALQYQLMALCWIGDRADEAHAVLDEAIAARPGDAHLQAVRSQLLLFENRVDDAGAVADGVLAAPGVGHEPGARAASVRAVVAGLQGDLDGARSQSARALALPWHDHPEPEIVVMAWSGLASALISHGALADARDVLAGSLATLGGAAASTLGLPWRCELADLLMLMGEPLAAVRVIDEGLTLVDRGPHSLVLAVVLALRARAEAQCGRASAARRTLDAAVERGPGGLSPRVSRVHDMARCWIAAAEGDFTTAADVSGATAARARSGGSHRDEALALLDQALFGRPDALRARQVATISGAPLLTAIAGANEAIAGSDPDRLVVAAEQFAAMQAPMVAAALARRATSAFTERGARHHIARAIELRRRTESMCEVAGPLLTDDAPAAPLAPSSREREAARRRDLAAVFGA